MNTVIVDRRRIDFIRVDQRWQHDRKGETYLVVGVVGLDDVILTRLTNRTPAMRPFRISRKSVWRDYTPVGGPL